jgi:hypothetical protein
MTRARWIPRGAILGWVKVVQERKNCISCICSEVDLNLSEILRILVRANIPYIMKGRKIFFGCIAGDIVRIYEIEGNKMMIYEL